MDILDLDWSYHHHYLLASGSIDNKILIWDISSHFEEDESSESDIKSVKLASTQLKKNIIMPSKELNEHSSYVKGISFDPIGKFLASCSSDNKLVLWEINDKKFNKTIKFNEPLKSSNNKNLFTRLSWTYDGYSLAVTNTVKNNLNIGLILLRNNLYKIQNDVDIKKKEIEKENENIELVGHKSTTVSTRATPYLLRESDSDEDPHSLIALADDSGVLSIWSTKQKRALIIFNKLFKNTPINDLSWVNNNSKEIILAACSSNGHVIFINFKNLYGKFLSSNELNSHYLKLYGKSINNLVTNNSFLYMNSFLYNLKNSSSTTAIPSDYISNDIIESNIDSKFSSNEPLSTEKKSLSTTDLLSQQVVSRTSSGKKRVSPIVLISPTNSTSPPNTVSTGDTQESKKLKLDNNISTPIQSQLLSHPPFPSSSKLSTAYTYSNLNSSSLSIIVNNSNLSSNLSLPFYNHYQNSFHNFLFPKFSKLNKNFYIHSYNVIKPNDLKDLKKNHGNIIKTSFNLLDLTNNCTTNSKSLWETIINGNVTSMNSFSFLDNFENDLLHLPKSNYSTQNADISASNRQDLLHHFNSYLNFQSCDNIPSTNTIEEYLVSRPEKVLNFLAGLVIIGCSDGTFHLLNISNGHHLFPPFILGNPIALIDINKNLDNEINILIFTSVGEIYMYNYDPIKIKIRKTNSISIDILISNIKNQVQNFTSQSTTSNKFKEKEKDMIKFQIVSLFLSHQKNFPIIILKVITSTEQFLKIFLYNTDYDSWVKLSDSKYFLSIFNNISLNLPIQHSPLVESSISNKNLLSFSCSNYVSDSIIDLNDITYKNNGLTHKDLLNITKIKLNTNNTLDSLKTSQISQARNENTELFATTINSIKDPENINEYSLLNSYIHIEELLISSIILNNEKEIIVRLFNKFIHILNDLCLYEKINYFINYFIKNSNMNSSKSFGIKNNNDIILDKILELYNNDSGTLLKDIFIPVFISSPSLQSYIQDINIYFHDYFGKHLI